MDTELTAALVERTVEQDGALWIATLNRPKGNILDTPMIAALTALFEDAAAAPRLKAIILTGNGPHFSFGASVADHLPGAVAAMLPRFHALFLAMDACAVPVIAAVRGQCLGGALELAAACHRVIASPDARLGVPEITLGVFPPVAALLLQERVGRPRAEELCLTGRILDAPEAHRIGLVDDLADVPLKAAKARVRKHLLPLSAASLRLATRAVRWRWRRMLQEDLPQLERLYLDELMATRDAAEGLTAFMERRRPVWEDA